MRRHVTAKAIVEVSTKGDLRQVISRVVPLACFNGIRSVWRRTIVSPNQQLLQSLYTAFNNRELETIISVMHPDVKWANGVEGGFVYGRDAVREYWANQYQVIQVQLEPLKFEQDENNRNVVTVHQVVRDLQGNLLADTTVQQIFTIEDGSIGLYEIGETETIQEMIQKTRTSS
jgi:hypothetical protein